MKKWYNVEIQYNTREAIKRACNFKNALHEMCIKFEASAAGENIHFEILLEEKQVRTVNGLLDQIIFYDAITEV